LVDKTDSYILQGCYFHLKNYIRIVNDKVKIVSLEDMPKRKRVLVLKGNSQDAFDYLDKQSVLENIQKCGLTDREKQVLFFLKEEFTVREIGKRLGISHVMVVKIKKKIKEKIMNSLMS
jgi:DNA-directed RNA polymerase specialized sigma subunit